jgi:chromosome partitioning protein
MIISFVNQKGGVGKSTTAINLAASLKRKNYSLVLIDADPQGSVVQWHAVENNNAFEILHHPEPLDQLDIKELAADYDYVVIDAPPAIGDIAKSILEVSDLTIVPLSPSALDIWSGWGTLEMIEDAKQTNPDLIVKLMVNRKIPGTRVGRDAREAIEVFDMEIFQTELCQRVAFIDAMTSGVSVMQYAPTSKAANEIESLTEEVILLTAEEGDVEEEEGLQADGWNSFPEPREEQEETSPWHFRFDR